MNQVVNLNCLKLFIRNAKIQYLFLIDSEGKKGTINEMPCKFKLTLGGRVMSRGCRLRIRKHCKDIARRDAREMIYKWLSRFQEMECMQYVASGSNVDQCTLVVN